MNRFTPRVILVIAWVVCMLYAYPGYLDDDATWALMNSRTNTYTNAGWPMFAYVWRWTSFFIGGPPGMLFLQATFTLLGAYFLVRRVVSDRAAALIAGALVLFPPVLATVARLCIDSVQVAFLLVGIVLLSRERRWVKIVGLVALVVATVVRPGGAAATLPIVLLGFDWSPAITGLKRIGLAFAAWIAVVAFGIGAVWLLVEREYDFRDAKLARVDIIETASRTEHIEADVAWSVFRASIGRLDDAIAARLIEDRRDLIASHTAEYVAHRGHMFWRLLGFKRYRSSWEPVYTRAVPYRPAREWLHHAARHSAVQKGLVTVVTALGKTPLFWPYVYLALALVLLGIAIKRRQRLEIMLLASGIAHELALAIVAPVATFRSSHWLLVSTLLALALTIARTLAARRSARPPAPA